jgi:2-methylcitrate dehydratase PrpD
LITKEDDLNSNYTRILAEYSADFRYEQLPLRAVEIAKVVVLDTLGAILTALPERYPAVKLIGDFVLAQGGTPECTIIGRGFKTSAQNAALVGGTMGYAADIEGAGAARMHAAACYVPTALVMGERQGLSGKAFIASLALAYDISARVSEAANTPHSYPHSFHPSAVFGTIGAAATAAFSLGLSANQYINAYGLAGAVASGLMTWVDDPTEHSRPYGIGVAARNGVTAALLAQIGFGGPQGIFDAGKYTIYDAFSGQMNLEKLTAGLGEDYWIEQADGFKRYPCCGDIHSGLDALLTILENEQLRPEDVAEITHRVKPYRATVIDNNPLRSHCSQYILAVAAVDRRIVWDDFLHDRRAEPTIGAMAQRTRLVAEPELVSSPGASPAIVEVRTVDGRLFRERVDYARGRSENPMTRQELEHKFVELAEPAVGEQRAREIIPVVDHLEELGDVCELVRLLQRP